MIRLRIGRVLSINRRWNDTVELSVTVDGGRGKAVHYEAMLGPVEPGDSVWLNTTAVSLGLGTGGYHFVMGRAPDTAVSRGAVDSDARGHIMKLRYTPFQIKVMAAEEEESPYRKEIEAFDGLHDRPVIVAGLHSALAPVAVAFKELAGMRARLAFVMTDGAALPLSFSRLVADLKERNLVDCTVTAGHAYGGDLEAVNLHSGIVVAATAGRADCIVIAMGPGVVGTGTRYGTTALEQGIAVDAAATLGGYPIAVARISFADPRPRHNGLSHHTVTALGEIAHARACIPIPKLQGEQKEAIAKALTDSGLHHKHDVVFHDAEPVLSAMERHRLQVTTMGRTPVEDPAYFLSAAAAGMEGVRQHVRRTMLSAHGDPPA